MKTNWIDYHNIIVKTPKIKNPTVLAFSAYFHDSSACIIKNGKIIAAADEERFTRKKHDANFPAQAIDYCLKEAKVNKVDAVVFYEDPDEKWKRVKKMLKRNRPPKEIYDNIVALWKNFKAKEKIQEKFEEITGLKNKIIFLDHHLSHAASSYYLSGFDEATVVTIDGVGEKNTTTFGYAKGNKIILKKCIEFPDSIGLVYTALTAFLGFKANSDEYKVMGLAPYGKMNRNTNPYYKKMQKLITLYPDGSYKLDMKYFGHGGFSGKAYANEMIKLFNIMPREKESEVNQDHKDLAAALQMITEDAVLALLRYAYAQIKCENLCLAGGVALNSVLNGKILSHTPFKNIFIQPSAGDSGTIIGAAKYIQHRLDSQVKKEHLRHSYFGPGFTSKEIKKYLDDNKIQYKKFNSETELLKTAAKLLYNKKVLGWFQGRMEWGPRALGNRSILATPMYEEMKEVLNVKVKRRELFRPFAPVVCIDDAMKYFEGDNPIPEPTDYMLMVYPIKKDKQELIPAVTHVDGSGRLQTIRKHQNPLYYKLIKQFGKISGVPILVNTSFNIRGEPIVCTPHDAYRCMMGTEIDCLMMGKFLIYRKENLRDKWDAEVKE